MALNLFKTIIAVPDDKQRIIAVNSNNACAVIFNPATTSLGAIQVLVKFDSVDSVRYTAYVVPLVAGVPDLAGISDSDLSSITNKASVDVSPSGINSYSQWITFQFANTIANTSPHALVVTSNAVAGRNGVLYRERTQDTADISGAYTFAASRGTWAVRQELGQAISPCIMYLGEEYNNSTNPIDFGTTKTSGQGSLRGFPLWMVAKNTGSTVSGRVSLYQASDGTQSTSEFYPSETYHASFPWLRYEAGQLPLSSIDIDLGMVDAFENPANGILPGDFILFCQKDRSYPLPKIFMSEFSGPSSDAKSAATKVFIARDTVVSDALDSNLVEVFSATDANITIRNDISNQKQSFIKNSNIFNESVKSGSYISRISDSHPDNSFLVGEVISDSNEIRVSGRRLHPAPEWKVSPTNIGSNSKAVIDHRELSSVYANGFEMLQFTPSSRCRFYESKSDAKDGNLSWSLVFPIDAHSGNDYDGLTDKSTNDKLPYICVSNYTGIQTGKGNYLNCPGISIYSGKASQNKLSYVIPEKSDKEAMHNLGLMSRHENVYGSIPNAQGLVYLQHNAIDKGGKSLVDAFLVRDISDVGIILDSRILSATFIGKNSIDATTPGETTLTLPELNLTTTEISDAGFAGAASGAGLWLIPSPFENIALASGNSNFAYKITNCVQKAGGTGVVITVNNTSGTLVSNMGTSDPSIADIPCYIVYRDVVLNSAGEAVYGYGQFQPDSTVIDFNSSSLVYTEDEVGTDGLYKTTSYTAATDTYADFTAKVTRVVIGLVNDVDEKDYNSKNYFYSKHNEKQMHDFIDRLPNTVIVVFEAVTTDTGLTPELGWNNKLLTPTLNKARVTRIFELMRKGTTASNNYTSLFTKIKAVKVGPNGTAANETDNNRYTWSTIVFGSGKTNNSTDYATYIADAKNQLDTFAFVGFARIHSAAHSDFMEKCADSATTAATTASAGPPEVFAKVASVGKAATYTNSRNLSDIMFGVISPVNKSIPNTIVKNYSLIIPMFMDNHQEVFNKVKTSTGELGGNGFKAVGDFPLNYEAIQLPFAEWSENDNSYAVIKPYNGPLYPENITSQSLSTLFTFDAATIGPNNKNSFVWNVKDVPVDNLDRIFFMYKINSVGSSGSNSNRVNCTIQLSKNKGFSGATTVFSGTIESNTAGALTSSSDTLGSVNAYAMPDGYNLFCLDMSRGYGDMETSTWMRIHLAPSIVNGTPSRAKSVNIKSLKAYSSYNTAGGDFKVLAGNATTPEDARVVGGAIFSKAGDYVVADLGAERFVSNISMKISNYSGIGDTLDVSYKSFIKSLPFSQNEKLLKQFVLDEEPVVDNKIALTINSKFYARFIIFKANALSSFNLNTLAIKCVKSDTVVTTIYGTDTTPPSNPKFVKNMDMIFTDENINTAPRNRVCIFDNTPNTVFATSYNEPANINQISFNASISQKTLFRIRSLPDTPAAAGVSAWSGLGNVFYQVHGYDRIDNLSISTYGKGGTSILSIGVPVSKLINNGLSGYVLRVSGRDEIIIPVVSSNELEIKLTQDIGNFGIVDGTEYYLEKPNIINFPSTPIEALEIKQVSGGETKVNSLKIYSPFVDSNGDSVGPTANPLSWNIRLDY